MQIIQRTSMDYFSTLVNYNSLELRFTPSIYSPDAPLGMRISNKDMPTTDIARVYHSVASLTPSG